MKVTYRKESDYFIPNLTLASKKQKYQIGKYGNLRLNYIKEYKKGLYEELILDGTLNEHLAYIENEANAQIKATMTKLAEIYGINEELKQNNQMEWVALMNNLKNATEEIVLNELIYV